MGQDMKIKAEHLERLGALIKCTNLDHNRELYRTKDSSILRIDQVKDLNRRFRWDCMWGDQCVGPQFQFEGITQDAYDMKRRVLVAELYEYMTDEHIDTALRSLVKPLAGTIQGKCNGYEQDPKTHRVCQHCGQPRDQHEGW